MAGGAAGTRDDEKQQQQAVVVEEGRGWTMICIECAAPVADTYKEFSKGNIRLTRCVRHTPDYHKHTTYTHRG